MGVDATAQAKKDHPTPKKTFKTLELKQNATQTSKLKGQSKSQQLAAAKAKQQQRAATRGDKQTRPNSKMNPNNVPAKVKAKRGVANANGSTLKLNMPSNIQLKTIPRDEAQIKKNRQTRVTELRKKLIKE